MTNWLYNLPSTTPGRIISITPSTSPFKAIHAGRIVVNGTLPRVIARNEGRETTLLCMSGSGRIRVGGDTFEVGRFDGVYVGRGEEFEVTTDTEINILEGSAPTEKTWPTRYVSFERDVKNSDALTLHVGAEPYYRDIHKVLAENVEGSRLLMGVTMSKPGNWTSWPPHEHAATREELYVFFDMPRPGFGTQFIYNDLSQPEIVEGYHPNVAAPGYPINFCWILCSLEDDTWRTLANVNVQKGFESMPTGLR